MGDREELRRIAASRAPESITLYVCPVCGRDDRRERIRRLGPHYLPYPHGAQKCEGRPEPVAYSIAQWVQWDLKHNPPAPPPSTADAGASTPTPLTEREQTPSINEIQDPGASS